MVASFVDSNASTSSPSTGSVPVLTTPAPITSTIMGGSSTGGVSPRTIEGTGAGATVGGILVFASTFFFT